MSGEIVGVLLVPTAEWREALLAPPREFPGCAPPMAWWRAPPAGARGFRWQTHRYGIHADEDPTGGGAALVLAWNGAVVREGLHRLADVLTDRWGTTVQRWSWTERLGGGAWTVFLYTPDGPPLDTQEPPGLPSPVGPPLLRPWAEATWAAERGMGRVVLVDAPTARRSPLSSRGR